MGSSYSEASKRAHQKYYSNTDEIRYRTKKGRKAEVTAHAESMGETLGQFVDRAIDETMGRDSSRGGQKHD